MYYHLFSNFEISVFNYFIVLNKLDTVFVYFIQENYFYFMNLCTFLLKKRGVCYFNIQVYKSIYAKSILIFTSNRYGKLWRRQTTL